MIKKKMLFLLALLSRIFFPCATTACAQDKIYSNSFDKQEPLSVVGRGQCRITDGVLKTKGNYACFGKKTDKNYTFSFRARAPKGADQVQIWAGFHAANRNDRYILGLKGGLQDDIYLTRLGYMGADAFMGVRPLGFHPVPGEWYKIRVEVCDNRIRVFVEDNKLPYIDIVDKGNQLAQSGQVTLGGGWIDTEYDNLVITSLPADYLNGVKDTEYAKLPTKQEKESLRKQQRAQYQGVNVQQLTGSRTDVSLDGKWLFMPEYQLKDAGKAISAATDDKDWHVMDVPNFWNPIRIWLHGETMAAARGQESKGVSDTYYQKETNRCENYTFDYHRTEAAWYRQWVNLPKEAEGKNLKLTFDAVSKIAEVYVNGQLAGSHIGMFGEIQVDCSKLMHAGKNLVVVKVTRDYVKNIGDADKIVDVAVTVPVTNKMLKDIAHGFYQGDPAGIWQPVKLTITSPMRIDNVFIKPRLDGGNFDLTVNNTSVKSQKFSVYVDIINKSSGSTLYSGLVLDKQKLQGNESRVLSFSVDNLRPKLWSPDSPNLYDFKFRLVAGKKELDQLVETSGFRTFVVKDGLFYLNGHKFWLRGGNHIPFALRPNDLALADRFMTLMREGNVNTTRTHTSPWNELWMAAADRNGIGVSYEGSWPWLMLQQASIPDDNLLTLWRNEWLALIKKYRNHPSLLFWTVNNEMKFYDNDPDKARAMKKFQIISDVVKQMRQTDSTRPVSFDSNYHANTAHARFGDDFMATIDDGDIDDMHAYFNWYNNTLFKYFNGELQKSAKMSGRPLISQEMSTGYPNNETGHPCRYYQIIHQNPMSLVGYDGYDYADPACFLNTISFTTGELAEALRRSNDQASGIMHFAYMTWLQFCYDAKLVRPYPVYYALKRALQPVLVSAEIWGRNLYAGEKLVTRFCIVNDREDGSSIGASEVEWQIKTAAGKILSSGKVPVPAVEHYTRQWVTPAISLPIDIPSAKSKLQLALTLKENSRDISANVYDLNVCSKSWNKNIVAAGKHIVVLAGDDLQASLDMMGVTAEFVQNIGQLLEAAKKLARKKTASLVVLSGVKNFTAADAAALRRYTDNGGKLLILNSNSLAKAVYPEHITGFFEPTEGDIAFMEENESPVFDGIDPMELRYFNNNQCTIPTVCNSVMKTVRSEKVTPIAGHMKIHAYIEGNNPSVRENTIESMRGFTIVNIAEGKGSALISTMATDKATTDPIAARLLVNMIK